MLLRYLLPLIIILLTLGCSRENLNSPAEEIHRVGVLGLFNPKTVQLSFPEGVLVKTDYDQFIPISKDESITINFVNSHLTLETNNKLYKSDRLEFYTLNKNPYDGKCKISIPGKISREYRGGIEIKSGKSSIVCIVLQKTEELVCGILSSESSDTEPEYLKALAVIIRTYILHNRSRHFIEGFDFCDNTHCMVFYGEQNKNRAYASAAKATKGEILKYKNRPVDVFFTGSCGGITKTPAMVWDGYTSMYPYKQIKCNFCKHSNYRNWFWHTNLTEISSLFPDNLPIKNICIENNSNSPQNVLLKQDNQTKRLTVDEFRLTVGRALGWNKIYSNNYNIIVKDDSVIIKGQGFGHCIGLCQSGAKEMSRQGKTYLDILRFYYPEADEISK